MIIIPRMWIKKEVAFTHDGKQQGKWDRVAELMNTVFRDTSPLSRGTLRSKGGGKLSVHFFADGGMFETVFAQKFQLISSVSTEQSQICAKNTNLVM